MAKITNKTALQYAISAVSIMDNSEVGGDRNAVIEKLEAMIAQLEKKSGAERKPTARQSENAKIKASIVSEMEPNVLYLVGDILKGFKSMPEDMTSQRLSAILNQMVASGEVEKTTEKNKSYFSKI